MVLTTHQQQALAALKAFLDGQAQVFILKGYAGTGKTTLLGHLMAWLPHTDFQPVLLATTGRAAKVLQNKTGYSASTVHSCIYLFDEIAGGEPGKDPFESNPGQLHLQFSLRRPLVVPGKLVYIVDEASMIAHQPPAPSEQAAAKFGSGSLLRDFLQYAAGHKIVFVGDPCQLPPVSEDPFSAALDAAFLRRQFGLGVESFELQEILRQDAGSRILQVAGKFRRGILQEAYEKYPKIPAPQLPALHLHEDDEAFLREFVRIFRQGEQDAIVLGNANYQCQELNIRARQMLKRPAGDAAPGDLLMVVQNSYNVNLANGDQVLVEDIHYHGSNAGYTFYKVRLRALYNDEVFETLMLRELLFNNQPGLSPYESRQLLIDFDQRARRVGLKRKTDEYIKAMMTDPYYNALRAKFGYAVTCHKAQGGEWPNVFLHLYPKLYGMPRPQLYRWFYTALTRAQERLHVNGGWWVSSL